MSLLDFFKEVEIFSCFSDQELQILADSHSQKTFEFGEIILESGQTCDSLYLIRTGRARLFISEKGKEKSLGLCKAGDTFSESILLKEGTAGYSVRSSGKTELLIFPRQLLVDLLEKNKKASRFVHQYMALKAVGGIVAEFFNLKKNKVEREEYEEIIQSIGAKRVRAGKEILKQDSGEDRRLYIVRSGQVDIIRSEGDERYQIRSLTKGEVFGEKSCIDYSVQPASAVAASDCLLIIIPQPTVQLILQQNATIRKILEERIAFFDKELERQKKVASWQGVKSLVSSAGSAGIGGKIIKRFGLVEQAEEMDCGAACLAMVCKHHKIPMTLGKLREMANVTSEGATMESLAQVGESLGFATKGVRCTYGSLQGFDLPFVAHWEGYHYIVVYGISKSHIWVADPGAGFRKMSVAEFEQGWTGNCLLFQPTENMAELEPLQSPWKRFIGYLKPMKRILRDLFLAALIMQLLGLVAPIIIQNVLDKVVVHQNYSLLNMMIMGLGIAMVFSQLTELVSAYLANFLTRKMDFTMMAHFLKHVLSLPVDFFAKRKTGDIIARFQENETIRSFMTESSIGTVLNAFMVVVYMVVLFKYSVSLTFVLIGFLIPLILITLLATPKYKKYARDTFYAQTDSEAFLMETLGGAESVKAMSVERTMRMKWEKKYTKALDIQFRSEMFTSIINGASELLKAAASIAILWFGARMVLNNEFTIGQMMAYNALVGAAMTPVLGLVGVWDEFQEALVSMERLGDVLDLEPEQKKSETSSRVILPDLDGDIRCEDLYFRYGEKSGYILENISMTIHEGSTVAIVGPSGSGKTTLAKLLVGLYRATEGKISVCDYDMESVDLEYYRRHIGYVMQNNLLFAGTVSENIAMGATDADQRRVMQAAKLADAHGFITNLPIGYEQVVGERGVGLSGGQIQRICIARALYNEPKFLIFDEATSALDGESEHHIQSNMEQILANRTAVIIAHRLSTVMNADQIFVLYDGRIVEKGVHSELVDARGMYYQLFQKQISASDS
ncbi:MAG: peptidase domain-containing ABC transporter [Thermodesulfobacteriota bacterium]